jgi:hypothetical protein
MRFRLALTGVIATIVLGTAAGAASYNGTISAPRRRLAVRRLVAVRATAACR